MTAKERPLYAYRLIVEYPAGVDWLHPPHLWEQERAEGEHEDMDGFSWPQTRRYLSYSGAKKRADLLRRYLGWIVLAVGRKVSGNPGMGHAA